jgi:hypothetical protein
VNKPEDSSLDGRNTRSLFFSLCCVAVFIPAATLAIVFAYATLSHTVFSRHDWKQIILCLWALTLVGLLFIGIRERRGRAVEADTLFVNGEADGSEFSAMKWEQRKSKRLFLHSYFLSLVLPAVGIAVAAIALRFHHQALSFQHRHILISCYAITASVLLLRAALRSRREKLVYRQ